MDSVFFGGDSPDKRLSGDGPLFCDSGIQGAEATVLLLGGICFCVQRDKSFENPSRDSLEGWDRAPVQ